MEGRRGSATAKGASLSSDSDNDRDGQSCHLNVAPLVFCMENGEWRMEMGEKGQRTVQIV